MTAQAIALLKQVQFLAGQDVSKNCNYRFKNFLRLALIDKQLSPRTAQDVVAVMPVDLPNDGLADEYLKELGSAFADLLVNLHDAYEADDWADPEAALIEASKAAKVWLNG